MPIDTVLFVPVLVPKSAIARWRWLVIMWAYRMVIRIERWPRIA